MRIAVVSDSHGVFPSLVWPLLDGADLILHAGDVGDPELIEALRAIAPVHAVWGNTDGRTVRMVTREIVDLELSVGRVVMEHGDRLGRPSAEMMAREYPDAALVVYGHTHIPIVQQVGSVLVVNPGSVGAPRGGRSPSIAMVDWDQGRAPRARIVDVDP